MGVWSLDSTKTSFDVKLSTQKFEIRRTEFDLNNQSKSLFIYLLISKEFLRACRRHQRNISVEFLMN